MTPTDPFPAALAAITDPAQRKLRGARIRRLMRRIMALHEEAADLGLCETKGHLLAAWTAAKRMERKP